MVFTIGDEIPISSGLSVAAFGQLSAMASLMSPDSRQLPVEVALVFKNASRDPIAFEVDTASVLLTNVEGKEYGVTNISKLLPDSTQHIEKGSLVVSFWVPAARIAVLAMSFIPLRADTTTLLESRIRGPVSAMGAVPSTVAWSALPSIEIPIGWLPRFSSSFLSDIAGNRG